MVFIDPSICVENCDDILTLLMNFLFWFRFRFQRLASASPMAAAAAAVSIVCSLFRVTFHKMALSGIRAAKRRLLLVFSIEVLPNRGPMTPVASACDFN